MYNIVGHFGSRFSYATIAARLARALRSEGLLRLVVNLDDKWLDEYIDIAECKVGEEAKHSVLITDPQEYLFDMQAERYGADNVAVFASPNTTSLETVRASVCSRAGLVLAPSQWCVDTVARSIERDKLPLPTWLSRVPLGFDDRYLAVPQNRKASEKVRFLHLSTDFGWPGRKGTEELLEAWALVQDEIDGRAELVVHVPMALYESVHYKVADLDLHDVELRLGEGRGLSDEQLAQLYEGADVVVLPSRSEGFGMMMLAALVSQTPLLVPYATGQVEFLSAMSGWMGIPVSDQAAALAGEDGLAPIVDPRQLSCVLLAASCAPVLDHLRDRASMNAERADVWKWDRIMNEWIVTLEQWRVST